MNKKQIIGVDVGSVSVNTILMDSFGEPKINEEYYDRHCGDPLTTVKKRIDKIFSEHKKSEIEGLAFTGSGAKAIAENMGALFVNEVIAQSKSVIELYPHVKSVIEMGGEDSKLLIFKTGENGKATLLDNFSLNTLCSAGTGSFLDQQASRLGISIENEFGEIALKSNSPARIAGRCSVFAKSDMIHLQQIGTPVADIVAGLCFALAQSFKSSLAQGLKLKPPVLFQGGVAANKGLLYAFTQILNLNHGEIIVPKHHAAMGAIGAAFCIFKNSEASLKKNETPKKNISKIFHLQSADASPALNPMNNGHYGDIKINKSVLSKIKIPVCVGIDIGSLSTNLAVIDGEKNILARRYLRTGGKPIEAVTQGLFEIGNEIANSIEVIGVGVTGSGRYMVGNFVGADVIKNEITAQATAGVHFYPDVETIFEIGGQDSKYISINNGVVVDFEMNKVCAAGTGSFLEEQAERIGIDIKNEFSECAFKSHAPGKFGDRCTVFIESDLIAFQQKGASKEDIVAGLSYSVAHNYLKRVVGNRKIGDRILFQGGVAWNRAVIAALSKITGKKIIVPSHHDITGAIGAAILALNQNRQQEVLSNFKGFNLSDKKYRVSAFNCTACSNVCQINSVIFDEGQAHAYGARCDKYEKQNKKEKNKLPDLFEEREQFLFSQTENSFSNNNNAPVLGIPRALHMHEFFPFWRGFFSDLGFRITLSEKTNQNILNVAADKITAETCLPIKIIYGHILNLLTKRVSYVFMPSLITVGGLEKNIFTCPLIQAAPSMAKAALENELKESGIKILNPDIHFHPESKILEKNLILMGRELGVFDSKVKRAIKSGFISQHEYTKKVKIRGGEIFSLIKNKEINGIAVISRSYNGCDRGMNMGLPQKLKEMKVVAIPMDFLPEPKTMLETNMNMYWKSGYDFFKAVSFLKQEGTIPAISLSSFKCGPDSFISHFLRRELKGLHVLELELDEHNADAGFVTRCEAFLDGIYNLK